MPSSLARYYDRLVNWERRLAREIPFLKQLITGQRVLVAGCGTGGHLPALAAAGFEVLGIDNDPDMVAAASPKCERVENCTVKLFRIEDCPALGDPFDAILVLGNVLPGFYGPNVMEAALLEMYKALAPGGLFFTQNLNYDKRWREKTRTFPLLAGRDGEAEVILFKFVDYGGGAIDFHANFIVRDKPDGPWRLETRTSKQRPVFQYDLENACRLTGFKRLETWGSYNGEPFDVNSSHDLLLAAWK